MRFLYSISFEQSCKHKVKDQNLNQRSLFTNEALNIQAYIFLFATLPALVDFFFFIINKQTMWIVKN